ncbi:MAG: Uncharacterised protein [Prochlorococcus marinus str. MIT 9215]|nr:MAG: Uncharacterised protein [Prochlorococcus marinus str. MIT 9215]
MYYNDEVCASYPLMSGLSKLRKKHFSSLYVMLVFKLAGGSYHGH